MSVVRRMATVVLVYAALLMMIVRIPVTALAVVSVMAPSPNLLALQSKLFSKYLRNVIHPHFCFIKLIL
jgi:hypothetical protein